MTSAHTPTAPRVWRTPAAGVPVHCRLAAHAACTCRHLLANNLPDPSAQPTHLSPPTEPVDRKQRGIARSLRVRRCRPCRVMARYLVLNLQRSPCPCQGRGPKRVPSVGPPRSGAASCSTAQVRDGIQNFLFHDMLLRPEGALYWGASPVPSGSFLDGPGHTAGLRRVRLRLLLTVCHSSTTWAICFSIGTITVHGRLLCLPVFSIDSDLNLS